MFRDSLLPSFPTSFLLFPLSSFLSHLPPFQLFDVVVRYETLRNVINSGTRNLKSILLTAVLAVILIFLYSIIGYVFFPDDFLMPTNPRDVHAHAYSVVQYSNRLHS